MQFSARAKGSFQKSMKELRVITVSSSTKNLQSSLREFQDSNLYFLKGSLSPQRIKKELLTYVFEKKKPKDIISSHEKTKDIFHHSSIVLCGSQEITRVNSRRGSNNDESKSPVGSCNSLIKEFRDSEDLSTTFKTKEFKTHNIQSKQQLHKRNALNKKPNDSMQINSKRLQIISKVIKEQGSTIAEKKKMLLSIIRERHSPQAIHQKIHSTSDLNTVQIQPEVILDRSEPPTIEKPKRPQETQISSISEFNGEGKTTRYTGRLDTPLEDSICYKLAAAGFWKEAMLLIKKWDLKRKRQTTKKGDSILHLAVRYSKLEVLKQLLQFEGINGLILQSNLKGETPLRLALDLGKTGHYKFMERCIKEMFN